MRAHLSACLERQEDGGTLYLHLRHSGKIQQAQGQEFGARADSEPRRHRSAAPIVAAKSRIGDWEADTIIGANHKGVVMSRVERTSKYTKLAKLPDISQPAHASLPLADRIETITYDNGKEFASHAQIAGGTILFCAKPYHSWERGLNEHTNSSSGSASQRFQPLYFVRMSKGSRTKLITRKILGYQTVRTHIRRKPGVADAASLLGGKRSSAASALQALGPQAVSRAPAARARHCAWPDRLRLLRLDQARQAPRVIATLKVVPRLVTNYDGQARRPPATLVHADAHSRYVGSSRSTTRPPDAWALDASAF